MQRMLNTAQASLADHICRTCHDGRGPAHGPPSPALHGALQDPDDPDPAAELCWQRPRQLFQQGLELSERALQGLHAPAEQRCLRGLAPATGSCLLRCLLLGW